MNRKPVRCHGQGTLWCRVIQVTVLLTRHSSDECCWPLLHWRTRELIEVEERRPTSREIGGCSFICREKYKNKKSLISSSAFLVSAFSCRRFSSTQTLTNLDLSRLEDDVRPVPWKRLAISRSLKQADVNTKTTHSFNDKLFIFGLVRKHAHFPRGFGSNTTIRFFYTPVDECESLLKKPINPELGAANTFGLSILYILVGNVIHEKMLLHNANRVRQHIVKRTQHQVARASSTLVNMHARPYFSWN